MRIAVLIGVLALGQAWAEKPQLAVFEKGRPPFQVQLTHRAGKPTLTVVNPNGKQVWMTDSIVAGEGDFGVIDLEGDGVDEITTTEGRGPGDSASNFWRWDGKALVKHPCGSGFFLSSLKAPDQFLAASFEGRKAALDLMSGFERKDGRLTALRWGCWGRVLQRVAIRPIRGGFEVVENLSGWKWQGEGAVPMASAFGRPVNDSDLSGKSARELDLIRNSLFAVYGHQFKDPDLAAYFCKQPWYPKENQEKFMPPLLLENARFIAEYQRQHKLNH